MPDGAGGDAIVVLPPPANRRCRSRVKAGFPTRGFPLDRVRNSALALLVASVAVADDHHATVTANHLAVLADLLDAGLNLHCCPTL
jgi:hypothetical protein